MPGGREDNGACNLSIAMAEIGRKVLLIDGDLRRPRLYKVFGMENTWGLSDQVRADFPLDSVPISDLVRQTEVSGLSVLPGGQLRRAPDESLLFSAHAAPFKALSP